MRTIQGRDGRWGRVSCGAGAERGAVALVCLTLALLLAASHPGAAKTLADFLADIAPADVIPGGASFGTAEGEPPLVPVLDAGGERLGWAYLNTDFTTSIGYSGKPIRIVVGIDEDGKVRGLKLVEHHEPIVLIGIPEPEVMAALNGLIDQDLGAVAAGTAKPPQVDIVSGATVTVLVMGDSVVRSAVKLIRSGRLAGARPPGPRPRWRSARSIRRRPRCATGRASSATARSAACSSRSARSARRSRTRASRPPPGIRRAPNPEDRFIELYVAPVSVPAIGRSLLGEAAYDRLAAKLAPGQARAPDRRRRRLFVQGLGLRARRHLRPRRADPGRPGHRASATATTRG